MAPRVQFYHNTPDRLVLTRELVANAHERGRKIAIYCADAAQLKRLDQSLWTAEPLSFIPHVAINSPLAGETPVVLYDAAKKLGKGVPKEYYVTVSDAFLAAAQERFGKDCVKLK